MSKELSPQYQPNEIEDRIYRLWEESGFFNPDKLPKTHKKPFTIIMPPPNASAAMHIGNAVGVVLQDIMIRYKRMRGSKTLWLPGTDHAGFETQVVFDKKLQKEGRNRSEIPRDELYRQMLEFTLENRKTVEHQLRKLGASCDWSREKFTLDPDIVEQVQKTFVDLYNDGLIYRGERVINWCRKHQTALADLETKHVEQTDPLYYFKYGPFVIATARPETKFGDKYVVMHPKDSRYKEYTDGQKIEVEWINGLITATIIKDEVIDMSFGTGAMTITPWHDAVDFELAQRRGFPKEQVIDKYGKLLPIAETFAGMRIDEARPLIVEHLKQKGLLVKIEEHYMHNVSVCYKCTTPIEPQVMPQWFLKMAPLAKKAIEIVQKKKIVFVPARFKKVYLHWLTNIRDWNLSQQITWGIRIPAWFKTNVGSTMQAVHFSKEVLYKKLGIKDDATFQHEWAEKEKLSFANHPTDNNVIQIDRFSINKLKDKGMIDEDWITINRIDRPTRESEIFVGLKPPQSFGWVQDQDVFTTWFSSSQWPYLALGYPKSKDFKTFYPTDIMETGWDILFFWVARMVMLGLYRTRKIPFKTIYLHGLVRDKDRQKMSKSKGNVIDPLGVAETYGTDAVRMALVIGNLPGNDIIISEEKIKGYRNFANKIWNATRFVLMHAQTQPQKTKVKFGKSEKAMLAKLKKLTRDTTRDMEAMRFHHAADRLYHFFWHYYADVVIEQEKVHLVAVEGSVEKETAKALLLEFHRMLMILLHPFMPFITEEIWAQMPLGEKNLLIIERWPK